MDHSSDLELFSQEEPELIISPQNNACSKHNRPQALLIHPNIKFDI